MLLDWLYEHDDISNANVHAFTAVSEEMTAEITREEAKLLLKFSVCSSNRLVNVERFSPTLVLGTWLA